MTTRRDFGRYKLPPRYLAHLQPTSQVFFAWLALLHSSIFGSVMPTDRFSSCVGFFKHNWSVRTFFLEVDAVECVFLWRAFWSENVENIRIYSSSHASMKNGGPRPEDENLVSKQAIFHFHNCWKNSNAYLWTPKQWKMKVLSALILCDITPKKRLKHVFPWYII